MQITITLQALAEAFLQHAAQDSDVPEGGAEGKVFSHLQDWANQKAEALWPFLGEQPEG